MTDAKALGFHELIVSSAMMKREGQSEVELTPGFLREETLALFSEWAARGGAVY